MRWSLPSDWYLPTHLELGAVVCKPGAIGICVGPWHASSEPQVLMIEDPESASRFINALTGAAMRAFPVDAGGSR